ncbi:MAG: hypothetical protein WDZ35_08770 [Crocinitomicaceae bacterium]
MFFVNTFQKSIFVVMNEYYDKIRKNLKELEESSTFKFSEVKSKNEAYALLLRLREKLKDTLGNIYIWIYLDPQGKLCGYDCSLNEYYNELFEKVELEYKGCLERLSRLHPPTWNGSTRQSERGLLTGECKGGG